MTNLLVAVNFIVYLSNHENVFLIFYFEIRCCRSGGMIYRIHVSHSVELEKVNEELSATDPNAD